MCIISIGILTPLYSISLFLPTIIKEMGYSNNAAQLMTVPVYIVACFCTLAGNYASDRARRRGTFVIGFQLLAILGFVLLITTGKPHVQYAGTFLAASGKISIPQALHRSHQLTIAVRNLLPYSNGHFLEWKQHWR